LLVFTGLSVFALMLTISLNQSLKQFVSLLQKPAILIRALLAVLVLFPALAIQLA
jgi:BASS family bile acid:Na+ symporter